MFRKVILTGATVLLTVMVVLVSVFGARPAAGSSADAGPDLAQGLEGETARWAAMGAYYARLAEAGRARAAEADAARWVATGQRYAASSTGADTARWAAVGAYYAGLAEAGRVQGAIADAARWAAVGQFYAGLTTE